MARGKLIVIDGLDGSGKATQSGLLAEAMARHNPRGARLVSFPDYESPSAALGKMYLAGEFGQRAGDVNAYAASSFYAVDRYASYRRFWEADYCAGVDILANRYATSNMIHQMGKLPRDEWDGFREWVKEFEYRKLGLPEPDRVLFLDMDPSLSARLLSARYHGDESKKDIHEADTAYLRSCRESALYAAEREGWTVIPCNEGESILSIEEVARRCAAAVGLE